MGEILYPPTRVHASPALLPRQTLRRSISHLRTPPNATNPAHHPLVIVKKVVGIRNGGTLGERDGRVGGNYGPPRNLDQGSVGLDEMAE